VITATLATRALAVAALLLAAGQRLPSVAAGQVSGVVITTDDPPQSVRRAIVSLADASQHLDFHTVSDDQGRFVISQLPKGRYTLQAARPSFVSIAYGATEPGRPGSPIILATDDGIQRDLRLRMARGAAISGTVRDSSGAVLPGRTVHVEWAGGNGLNLSIPVAVQTDDRGEFRFYGLAAGPYVVLVEPTTKLDVELPSDAEVDAALRDLQRQQSGFGAPAGPANPPPTSSPGTRKYTAVSVYFPTAFSRTDASIVTVGAGEDRRGTDIIVRLR